MSKQLKLKFNVEENNIKNRLFIFDYDSTFESILKQFLRESNSKMVLNPNKIQFLCKSKMLNSDEMIHTKASSFFKILNNSYTVQVFDANNIIGGNYDI